MKALHRTRPTLAVVATTIATSFATSFAITPALAHHGVASLGAAGLEGPGAPVETSSSATLPEGKWLGLVKLDYAKFRTFDSNPAAPEVDYNAYWMAGVGYGVKPWLSIYAFQPYNVKMDEAGGLNSRGPTDLSLAAVIGFKYDDHFMLVPARESLDDLTDWHFTVNLGMSLPTGNANHKLADGSIDPGKSLGFGKPSINYGMTATRQFSEKDTAVFEVNQIRFQKFSYDPDLIFPAGGQTMKFGTETRVNAALSHRLLTLPERKFRLDGNVELNYLNLGKDTDQTGPIADSGGDILYGVIGMRLYQDNMSVGLALKKPIWAKLNNATPPVVLQGAEGKESYRFIATFSAMF
jgi:hypothetical protein